MATPVLVVGGAGYIGSHTCKRLARSGFLPVVYDNLGLGHAAFVRWGPLVRGDMHDSELVAATIRQHQVQAVVHFAAFAFVGESVADPAKYYGNNVAGTLALLNGMRQAGCDKLVFSSTCAVYGEPDAVPITEQAVRAPVNPYGRSKLVCEMMLEDFGAAYGLRSIALRYFNASGADPDAEIGELRDPETHLIPRALMSLQGHVDDFAVFGSDFPTPDGTAIRDYIHVCDLGEAHVAAVEALLGGAGCGAYNLGTGTGYSVKQVLDAVTRVTGRALPAAVGPRRPGDPAELVAAPAAARAALRFAPAMSDLDTIIRTAWAWHVKAHPTR